MSVCDLTVSLLEFLASLRQLCEMRAAVVAVSTCESTLQVDCSPDFIHKT